MDCLFDYCVSEGIFPRSDEEELESKARFVKNLGILMSQTREGITGMYMDDREIVHVLFRRDSEMLINVHMDSYMAIIRDVVKHL